MRTAGLLLAVVAGAMLLQQFGASFLNNFPIIESIKKEASGFEPMVCPDTYFE